MSLVHQPACEPAPPPKPSGRRWPVLLAVAMLAALIAVVFIPVLGFEFIDFDTYEQVVENPDIRSLLPENLKRILTTRGFIGDHPASFYPIRTLTYALDYRLWGLKAGGFKLTNILIHSANALLVFWLVLRLVKQEGDRRLLANKSEAASTVPDALVALAGCCAAVFAIHPVVVEPVIWVPGREELLMTLGALGTIHFHITARRTRARGGSRAHVLGYHAGAVLCCAFACLSNAVAVVIAPIVLAWDLISPGSEPETANGLAPGIDHKPPAARFTRSNLSQLWWCLLTTAPLWVVAAATAVTKRLGESGQPVELIQMTLTGRLMVALNAYWLYLKSLVWPSEFCLFYDWLNPRSWLDHRVLIGIAAVALSLGALWTFRRRRPVVFGLLWFGLSLAPTILLHQQHRADRFLYLPLAGLMIAVAGLLAPRLRQISGRSGLAAAGLGAVIVLALAVRSAAQVPIWRTSLSVWQHCLALNPNNARAHDVVGDHFARIGQWREAQSHYETVLKLRPYAIETLKNYGYCLSSWEPEMRDYDRAVELVNRAYLATEGKLPDVVATLSDVHGSYAFHLQQSGQYARAIEEYRRALEVDPSHTEVAYNLALLLAICPDQTLRRPDEAVRLSEWARQAEPTPTINGLLIQATVYGHAGRPHAAMVATQDAIDLAKALGDRELVADLQRQLNQYRAAQRQ